jgi:hypothetical protein
VATHAGWTLDVTLAQPTANAASVLDGIGAAENTVVLVQDRRLTVRARQMDAVAALTLKDTVIARLEEAGAIVQGFRVDPPDLAGVYFALTGSAIVPSVRPTPRTGERQRTRQRA